MKMTRLLCAMFATGVRSAPCISDALWYTHIFLTVVERMEEGTSVFPLYKDTLSKQNLLGDIVLIVFVLVPCENSHIFTKLICALNGNMKSLILQLLNKIIFNVQSLSSPVT